MYSSDRQEILVDGQESAVPVGSIAPVGPAAGQPEVVETRRVEEFRPLHRRVVIGWNSGTLATSNRLLAALFLFVTVLIAIPFVLLTVGFLGVVTARGLFVFSLSWIRSKLSGSRVNAPHIPTTRNHSGIEN